MTSTSTEFFDSLSAGGHEPLLERVTATIGFDIADGERSERRSFGIDHGDIRELTQAGPVDCELAADRDVFDAVVDGRTTLMAALLRGAVTADGDPELIVLSQRLLCTGGAGRSS